MAASVQTEGERVQVLPWDEFREMFAGAHKQGEHVAAVGPTGGGKSTVCIELCKAIGERPAKDRRPSRVTVICTKRRDDTIARLHAEGWPILKRWPPAYGQEHCIVWPRPGVASGRAKRQAVVLGPLLDAIDQEGGQTVYVDEAAYFERTPPNGLGLGGTMEQFWGEARSNKLTVVAGTQRPRHVTRSMWSEPSWLVIIMPDDEDDLKRVAGLSGYKREVLEIVPRLGGYEFLCVRRQKDGRRGLYVSRVHKPLRGRRSKRK